MGSGTQAAINAEWEAARLPDEQAAVLSDAREAYLGIRKTDWNDHYDDVRQTVSTLRAQVMINL